MKLIPHAAHPPTAKFSIIVSYIAEYKGPRWAQYIVTGNVDAIRWPEPTEPARTDGLWRTTCFEIFVQAPDSEHYHELNFSPSGRWAAYDFDGYRAAMRERAVADDIAINVNKGRGFCILTAKLGELPLGTRCGFAAVIEELDGTKSYWALAHPSAEPDFHHSGSFIF